MSRAERTRREISGNDYCDSRVSNDSTRRAGDDYAVGHRTSKSLARFHKQSFALLSLAEVSET
jgi:hypothetical protein